MISPAALHIAYLAPELPALSATFVYEELLALERRGHCVTPFSVRQPVHAAPGQEALAARTRVLYGAGWPALAWAALCGLAALLALPGRGQALSWLASDMRSVGLLHGAAWKLAVQCLVGARLGRDLLRLGCDHLHVHFAHVPAQIAMYASAACGVPFTVTAHANDIFERGLLLPQKAVRARRLLSISQHNLRYLEGLGVPAERLGLVRCGVALAPPHPGAARDPAREGAGALRIGSLGRLVEKKGFDVLLQAFAQLAPRWPRLELRIAGDGPLRRELQSLADALGIAQRVRFDGALAHSQVPAWLREIDVFVLACKTDRQGDMDGIPVSLMEAMAQSVPVVSTRLSGIPELVVDGVTGSLAEPGDGASLAAAIEGVLGDASRREALAAAGASHVAREFGQERNLDRLLRHVGAEKAAEPSRLSPV